MGQEWSEIYKNESLIVSFKTINYTSPSNGHQHERVVFNYENRSNNTIDVTLNRAHYYGNQCYGCEGGELTYNLILPPKTTETFDKKNTSKTYYIFKKDLEGFIKKSLTDWKILNVKIETL